MSARPSAMVSRSHAALTRPPLDEDWLSKVDAVLVEEEGNGAKCGRRPEDGGVAAALKKPQEPECDQIEEEVLCIMGALQEPAVMRGGSFSPSVGSAKSSTALALGTSVSSSRHTSQPSAQPRQRGANSLKIVPGKVGRSTPLNLHFSSDVARSSSGRDSAQLRPSGTSLAQRHANAANAAATSLGIGFGGGGGGPPPASRQEQREHADERGHPDDLRAENERLYRELRQAQVNLEQRTKEAQNVKAERDESIRRTEAMKVFVAHLQQQLLEATERTRRLEERVSTVHDGNRVAPVASAVTASDLRPEPPSEERSPSIPADALRDVSMSVVAVEPVVEQQDSAGEAEEGSRRSWVREYCDLDNIRDSTSSPSGVPSASMANASDTSVEAISLGSGAHLSPASDSQPILSVGAYPASDSIVGECVTADRGALDAVAEDTQHRWEFVVQGHVEEDGEEGPDSKPVICLPNDALERARAHGVACICSRGHRLDARVPNQDDLLVAMCTCTGQGRVALYGVFDGHGPEGHHCAAFARGNLPDLIFADPNLLSNPQDVLSRAFEQTHRTLLRQPFDVRISGTTATVALILSWSLASGSTEVEPDSWVYIAHVGDSRAILASRKPDEGGNGPSPNDFSVTALTRDHRPSEQEEAERIRQSGGEIRKLKHNSAAARVYVPGQDYPAFALTRSLGDSVASECGVLAEPDVSVHRLRRGADLLLVLGTDGLFEFCGNEEVASQLLHKGVSVSVLADISQEARHRWAMNSYNRTVDDTTAIAISLEAPAPQDTRDNDNDAKR